MTTSVAIDSRQHRLFVRAEQVLLLVVALVLWQYSASGSKNLMLAVSTPTATVRWIGSWAVGGPTAAGAGWSDLWATLEVAGLGYLIGAGVGIVGGSIVGYFKLVREYANPFVTLLNAFPKIALAPLFVMILGASEHMQVLFVSAGTTFITFYAVYNGLQTIEPRYINNVRVLGGNRLAEFRRVYAPSIVGWLISGLRLTAAWSIASTVLIEFLTTGKGMGVVVAIGEQNDKVSQVLGGIIVASIAALVVDRVLLWIGRRFSSWRLA